MKSKQYKIGVLCSSPSVQMSAQYDVLTDLPDFKFVMLYRQTRQGNAAWTPQCPRNLEYEFLPPCHRLIPAKLKPLFNGNIWPVLDARSFDAMIIHGIYDSSAVWQAIGWCKRNKRPYLLRCDANVMREEESFLRKLVRKPIVSRHVRGAAALLYIGEQNLKYYELFGARPEQLFLAPWEIDYDDLDRHWLVASKTREQLRQKMNWSQNECIIITVSRLVQIKGYDLLIPAIKKLSAQGLKIRLAIAGEGPYRGRIEEMSKDAPIELLGNCDRKKIVELFAAADLFVLASVVEPWGLVVNEAALCGLPIIVSNAVGAGPDLVHNNENGYIYDSENIYTLYNCLKKLAEDTSLRRMQGQQGRKILSAWRLDHPAQKGYEVGLRHALGIMTNTELKSI